MLARGKIKEVAQAERTGSAANAGRLPENRDRINDRRSAFCVT